MDQDDQTQKCSSSSGGGGSGGGGGGSGGGGGRSSKKPKQKKAPQRGLGVAQLEKIRLEEQQKKAAAAIVSPPPTSSLSPTKSPFVSLPIPNYHHSNPSSSSNINGFPSPSPADPRPPQPGQQNILVRNSSTNGGGFDAGWSGISVPGVDPGLAFRSNLNLPYESDSPVWLPPVLNFPTTQQFQQPSHSMVNVSTGTSSSSVLNFRMEPPSNQSCYSNFPPIWPEEEKMVGMKRPYPFSLDNSPRPSFNYNLPAIVAPITLDESASCGNEGTFDFEATNTIFREGPLCSTSNCKLNSNKSIKENEVLHGDFLTLAPATTSMCPSSKLKHHSAYLDSHFHKFPDFESLPYQGSAECPIIQPGQRQFNGQQPFYSFFPPAQGQIGQATATINNCNGEVGESIDLNLKL